MTFDEWFQSKQGEAYASMYAFAKDAWEIAINIEREECAKVCDELAVGYERSSQGHWSGAYEHMDTAANECASEIRGRSD